MWRKALGIVKMAKQELQSRSPVCFQTAVGRKHLTFQSKCKEEGLPLLLLLRIQRVEETKGDRSFNPGGTLV